MIIEIIDKYFASNVRLSFEHKSRLYPAQASAYITKKNHKKLEGRCLRAAYYSCLGMQEFCTNDISKKLMSKIGEYTERMVLDILRSEGVLVESGVKFDIPKYNIFGKLDGIILVDGKEIGLEIKSVGSGRWTTGQIWGTNWNHPSPKWPNLLQTLVYAYALRERVQEFILFYIRRDTCETKEFRISIIAEGDTLYPVIDGVVDKRYTINEILDRYKKLTEFIESGVTPPKDYVKIYPKDQIPTLLKLGVITKKQSETYYEKPFGDSECKMCGYSDLCDKE